MASCDLCGREEPLLRILTEGTELDVCKSCARYGKVLSKPRFQAPLPHRPQPRATPRLPKEERIEVIVEDYGVRIKSCREKLGLTQEQFAAKLAERVSLLQKVESGHHEPDIALARKIERTFGIKLVEQHEETHGAPTHGSLRTTFTIGDFIKK